MRTRFRPRQKSKAFTLLEVILALAILAGSVAVLSEVMRIASRHATATQAETRAQMLASSVMNEMAAGLTEPIEQTRQALDVDDTVPWVCSVTFATTDLPGLTAVEVLVEQDVQPQYNPVKYRLVSWLPTVPETEDEDSQEGETEDSEAGQDDA
ncbi:MAG: type II secretion system GspH family protein [Pirellulales bacterium]|nr:type II secretion system GspH family protein [Pirellulales bacterium]